MLHFCGLESLRAKPWGVSSSLFDLIRVAHRWWIAVLGVVLHRRMCPCWCLCLSGCLWWVSCWFGEWDVCLVPVEDGTCLTQQLGMLHCFAWIEDSGGGFMDNVIYLCIYLLYTYVV